MIARINVRIAAVQCLSGLDLILPSVLEGLEASVGTHAGRHFACRIQSSLRVEPAARSYGEQTVCVAIDWPTSVPLAKARDIYGRILALLALRTELPVDSLILIVSRVPEPTERTALEGQIWRGPEAEAPAHCALRPCDDLAFATPLRGHFAHRPSPGSTRGEAAEESNVGDRTRV